MLEIIRLPSYNFDSKCGEIHSYNAMIFSITCNYCGLITNSFEQFCQHFKEYHFEPSDNSTVQMEDPEDDKIKLEDSDLESGRNSEVFSSIKDEIDFEEFELVKFEDNLNYELPEEEDFSSPKQVTISADIECLNEVEVEINKMPSEQTIVEDESMKTGTLLLHDIKDKDSNIKKKRKSKYIPKKKNKPTIRIFNCKHCGRSFSSNSNRNVHELRHKEIGDFHCNLCTKTFYTKMELTKHLRSHNDERPYVCEQCGKAFRHIWVLKKHSLTHTTRERTLPCPNCGKLFSSKDHVRRHILIHNTVPMFTCDKCDKVFTQRKRLTAHKRRHHSNS